MRSSLMAATACLSVLCACGGSDEAASQSASTSCTWHGNCSTTAPNGAYDCSGNSLTKCVNGQWQQVVSCPSLTWTSGSGFTYACTCKGGCGTTTTACSYAFNVCGGQDYPTLP